ncbi:MAG: UDP-N-acetylmuramate dehydrogenase [Algoriphagus sp.]|uniref:UDP-N-acetylmuramate dehydrogenase n=1 Tax=Algoriphagus sp. TaxID=1872435 RepID=UPI00260BCE76|nr:UDP-N-acetylmuramate dehydrogenase [Algoriphagus sp.]MDG1279039.1 UDP-N-acetylmuramate dehydrogenase [Algoriphagus sp.]
MKIIENFDLTLFNSYKITAFCKRAFFPECIEDFKEIFSKYNFGDNKIIIGGGYNLILSKDYYENDFILIGESFASLTIDDLSEGIIVGEAGVSTLKLSNFALDNGLSGLETFYDIPSSLGGAVVMNAGASGEEIKDILVKVEYLDRADMKIKVISKEDIGFKYRNSFFQSNTDKVVLKVWLQLEKGIPSKILEKMESIRASRWAKQPRDFPNAGSVFKRPNGFYVGPMIDDLKLKGLTIGGAQISEKHGGFIINIGNASGDDVLAIISIVQKKVKDKFGVDLEVEQRII